MKPHTTHHSGCPCVDERIAELAAERDAALDRVRALELAINYALDRPHDVSLMVCLLTTAIRERRQGADEAPGPNEEAERYRKVLKSIASGACHYGYGTDERCDLKHSAAFVCYSCQARAVLEEVKP